MSRNAVAQKAPNSGADFTAFPAANLPSGSRRFRAHSLGYGPWYFSNRGSGRFDLDDGATGTCYLADDVESSLRERFGERLIEAGEVMSSLADGTRVSTVITDGDVRAANVSDQRAAQYSVTRELCTMPDYEIPRLWAIAFDNAQFDGVRYASRFTTGGPNCWALFGVAGENTSGLVDRHLSGRDACIKAGIAVLGYPASWSLTVVSPGETST